MDKQMYKKLVGDLMRKESELKNGIKEGIKILSMYYRSCKISMGYAMFNTKKHFKDMLVEPVDSKQLELFDE